MSEPQAGGKRSLWESAGVRLGVISAAVGLVVALIGLPRTVANALGRSDSALSRIDLEQKRLQVAAAAPRLDVRYIVLSADIALGTTDLALNGPSTSSKKQPAAVTSILSLPTVEGPAAEVLKELSTIDDRAISAGGRGGCRFDPIASISVAFLVVTNRGSRDAVRVAVAADRHWLPSEVTVDERWPHPDDYVAKIRSRSTQSAPVTIQVPLTLGPGDGVRLPLFVIDTAAKRNDLWCVASRTVLLPRRVSFEDPILKTTSQSDVRRMQTPTLIAPGAYGRG